MDLFFNELSCSSLSESLQEARKRMAFLVSVLRAAKDIGIRSLRTMRSFKNAALSYNYTVGAWLQDVQVGREERVYLKTVAGYSPYIEELFESRENEDKGAYEFSFDGTEALGMGTAYLMDSACLSIKGDDRFQASSTRLVVTHLCSHGEIETSEVEVINFARVDHVSGHKEWVMERVVHEIQNGKQFWAAKEQFFPRLIFCQNTEQVVKAYTGREIFFPQLCRHLFVLNFCLSRWTSGDFNLEGIDWSTESKKTLTHKKYRDMRAFLCPDGQARLFSYHSKLVGANQRIHFFPLHDLKKAYVGYIGRHLDY